MTKHESLTLNMLKYSSSPAVPTVEHVFAQHKTYLPVVDRSHELFAVQDIRKKIL